MRTSALLGAKTFKFFEIYSVSARIRERGVEPVRTFFGKRGGNDFSKKERDDFSRFCANVFYGRPLTLMFYTFVLLMN